MDKLTKFGERTHFVQEVVDDIRPINNPVVAICGTVFKPSTWDPDPDLPICLGCMEMQQGMLTYQIEVLESTLRNVDLLLFNYHNPKVN